MRYLYVLLDADDTLFDFAQGEAAALQRSFEQFQLPYGVDKLRAYRKINAQAWELLELGRLTAKELPAWRYQRLFDGMPDAPGIASFADAYLENLSQSCQLIGGAEELLRSLKDNGVKVGLITNGIARVQRQRLQLSGVEDYFDAVLISEEVGMSKPDAGLFDEGLRKLGCRNRAEALIVGDSLSADIAGAFAAGLDSCWFNPRGRSRENAQPTYEVGNLPSVLPIVLGN